MNEHFPPRSSKRAPIAARVVFKLPDSTELEVRESDNLSLGGMFIKTPTPPPAGTQVDFEFVLTDASEVIRGNGEVTWRRMEDAGPDAPAGMGVRFLKLSPGSRAIIFHAVDRLIQEGGEPFDIDERPQPVSEPSAEPPAVEPAPVAAAAPASPAAPSPIADTGLEEPEVLTLPDDDEPLSELVARTTAPRPAPAPAEPETHDELERSSTRVSRGVYVRQEPERGRWWRLAAALLVVAGAGAGVWWFWPQAEPEPPELRLDTTSGITGVQAPGAEETTPTEAGPVELTGAGADPADGGTGPIAGAAVPPPAKPATEPEDLPPLTRIEEITWQRVDGGTEVLLLGDGAFAPRAWTHYHLAGGNPRELIKVRGVDTPYTRSLLPVGSDEVRQVRVGYHVLPQANELHVVMDLTGPGVEASTVEADGRSLRILIRSAEG